PGASAPVAIAWPGAGGCGSWRLLGGAGGSGWIASGFQYHRRSASSCQAPPAAIRSPRLALSPSAIRMPSVPLPSVSSISQTYGVTIRLGSGPAPVAAPDPAPATGRTAAAPDPAPAAPAPAAAEPALAAAEPAPAAAE